MADEETSTMAEEDPEYYFKAAVYGGFAVIMAVMIPLTERMPRTRGKNIIFHGLFLALAAVSVFLVPNSIQDLLFTETGVLVVGTIVPVYESIVAVCSIDEADDTAWLQFWATSATFTYATEFMDTIAEHSAFVAEHWYEFEFFFMLWLALPFTDGAAFIYDKFTLPYIAPICQSLKSKMDGWMQLVLAAVNSSYLYVIWFTFMTLPEEARRFVVVAVGTIYPLVASTVAITTETTVADDAFWLTYWSCFNILFIAMDYLESFVGHIKGFYSLCLVATVYLFLPMFRGAEVVFRRVLVPISGQYENMLMRDAFLLKRDFERNMPVNMHDQVLTKAANVFLRKEVPPVKKTE